MSRSSVGFVELMEIQGNLDLVTKPQLLEAVRSKGINISERQLTTYITAGLVPHSGRLGAHRGVLPRSAVELLLLISNARGAGRSIDAIKQLISVWKYLAQARRNGRVDFTKFEQWTREQVTDLEAAFSLPWLVRGTLADHVDRTGIDPPEFAQNGKTIERGDHGLTIEFVVAVPGLGAAGARRVASLDVSLFLPRRDERPSIVVGLPNRTELPDDVGFVELLEIQGDFDLVTKPELLEAVRQRGINISERQLTSYITAGLVPRSGRLGQHRGVLPRSAVELLLLVCIGRCAGRSIDAIKQLISVWKYLAQARRNGRVDFTELKRMTREHVTDLESAFLLPWLVRGTLVDPVDKIDVSSIQFVWNDEIVKQGKEAPTFEFVVEAPSPEAARARRVASLDVALSPPGNDGPPRPSIVVGIPNGVELPDDG